MKYKVKRRSRPEKLFAVKEVMPFFSFVCRILLSNVRSAPSPSYMFSRACRQIDLRRIKSANV